ncbi:MAG: helix-turn-helix transcriptional regulator [Actinomycetota bacterium]
MLKSRRLELGVRQAAMARRVGISASYLSRLEGAAWLRGGPWPSDGVLRALARALQLSSSRLIDLRDTARGSSDTTRGEGVQRTAAEPYRVAIGNDAAYRMARRTLQNTGPGTFLRAADVAATDATPSPPDDHAASPWSAIGAKLARDPGAVLHRAVFAGPARLDTVHRRTDVLAGGRQPEEVGNLVTRFCTRNPVSLELFITEGEAFVGLPDLAGGHLRAAIVIDDPDLVAALRAWFDETIWEPARTQGRLPAE